MITVCPIKGQVRRECASHPDCHQTCNTTGPVVCPRICIVNGCECPDGTVIDEYKNECVTPNECEGMLYNYFNKHLKNENLKIHKQSKACIVLDKYTTSFIKWLCTH